MDGSSSGLYANKKSYDCGRYHAAAAQTNLNKWVKKMFAGKNLENLDAALHECDGICFGLLGPQLQQVDIPWILPRTLAYLFGMNIPQEYHCEGQTRMLEQPCGRILCSLLLY